MSIASSQKTESGPVVQVTLAGFSTKTGADLALELLKKEDGEKFAALRDAKVAPSLGALAGYYGLLTAVGVLSFPLGVAASYLASVIFKYLNSERVEDNRIQIFVANDSDQTFIFVDKGTPVEVIEFELTKTLEQIWPKDGA
jgi:hypothetical protein